MLPPLRQVIESECSRFHFRTSCFFLATLLLSAATSAAPRGTASSHDRGQYRIVHFATHGLINNQDPELSGIVLSLVDEKGQPQNGFLRLYEILI